jgi:hypothetical protein
MGWLMPFREIIALYSENHTKDSALWQIAVIADY